MLLRENPGIFANQGNDPNTWLQPYGTGKSMVLSGSRMLSRQHIQALSTRFYISPAIFFENV